MRKAYVALGALVVAGVIAASSIFIVDEREKALVLQFGQIVGVKEEPGIGFKIPLIQEVVKYDDRILSRDMAALEVIASDSRRIEVDAFARYRIADVEDFRRATGSGGERQASNRLDSILRTAIRKVLGTVSSAEILSSDRDALMQLIRDVAAPEADSLGLQLIDVRLKRTDLPPENLEKTYERMIAEREREAADEIARGNEAAQRIRAGADRTVTELVSDAQRQAEIIRGEADAERTRIFAEAYGSDAEFFDFYRSLQAYRRALEGGNTSMVLTPDSDFFSYLESATGNAE
ncbi:protease modulator HflC [Marivivens aquimaris]|uniref:protease modulator HflC n=1 Tax=Marivivens aquimaris TaxID=2774876 RepID=UPI001882F634|nr:protease modulator HflC [Marivivens aquimaris]